MSATVRTVFGMSSLAAAGSTVTGTLQSIPSRQARTASMSSGVKSMASTAKSRQCCNRVMLPQGLHRQRQLCYARPAFGFIFPRCNPAVFLRST